MKHRYVEGAAGNNTNNTVTIKLIAELQNAAANTNDNSRTIIKIDVAKKK